MPERIRSIVVLGGDAAAASVAASVANSMRGTDVEVTLVDRASQYSGVEAATRTTVLFHRYMSLNEASLIANTGATFRLGTEYLDWQSPDHRMLLATGTHGITIRLVPFHQYMVWRRLRGQTADCNQYSLAACAAEAGRFAHPGKDPNAVTSTFEYGLQLDRRRYAGSMAGVARGFGVRHIESMPVGMARDPESGHVASLSLENGETVNGDLFIDCGGVLDEHTSGTTFEDWSQALPCDRSVTVDSAAVADMNPVSRIVAKDVGWQRRVQLTDRAVFELFYNSAILSDDDAKARLLKDVPEASGEPLCRPIARSIRKESWQGNVVAVGGAAADFESLETSPLSRAHDETVSLLALLPDRDCSPVVAAEFNRVQRQRLELTRDLQGLFYALSRRDESDFWRLSGALQRSEHLQRRIELFASTGRIERRDLEPVSYDYLAAIMLGLDHWPAAYDPLVDAAKLSVVESQLTQMREYLDKVVDSMPSHVDSLRMMAEHAKAKR